METTGCPVHAGLSAFVAGEVTRAGNLNALARKWDISFKCLAGIISGKHSPNLTTLVRIADGSGLSFAELADQMADGGACGMPGATK